MAAPARRAQPTRELRPVTRRLQLMTLRLPDSMKRETGIEGVTLEWWRCRQWPSTPWSSWSTAGAPCPARGPPAAPARPVALPPPRALVTLADRLYPVFAARTAVARARLVTALLADCDLRPALRADGDRVRPAWLVPRKRDALLAAAAVALHAQLAEHDHDRLGVCASSDCGDVYVDISPRAHRSLLLRHLPEPRAGGRLPPPLPPRATLTTGQRGCWTARTRTRGRALLT